MPEIKFPTEWLKLGINTQVGDVIQFLDSGTQNDEGQWIFTVAVFRDGEIIETGKKFGLNKTNFNIVSSIYGSNSDNWIEKEFQIEKVKVRSPQSGNMVDSILLSEVVEDPTK